MMMHRQKLSILPVVILLGCASSQPYLKIRSEAMLPWEPDTTLKECPYLDKPFLTLHEVPNRIIKTRYNDIDYKKRILRLRGYDPDAVAARIKDAVQVHAFFDPCKKVQPWSVWLVSHRGGLPGDSIRIPSPSSLKKLRYRIEESDTYLADSIVPLSITWDDPDSRHATWTTIGLRLDAMKFHDRARFLENTCVKMVQYKSLKHDSRDVDRSWGGIPLWRFADRMRKGLTIHQFFNPCKGSGRATNWIVSSSDSVLIPNDSVLAGATREALFVTYRFDAIDPVVVKEVDDTIISFSFTPDDPQSKASVWTEVRYDFKSKLFLKSDAP